MGPADDELDDDTRRGEEIAPPWSSGRAPGGMPRHPAASEDDATQRDRGDDASAEHARIKTIPMFEPNPKSEVIADASEGLETFAPDSKFTGPIPAGGRFVPGQVLFDRYIIEKQIGEGGMGAVWLVRHRALGSERALKMIVAGFQMNTEARARFLREARIMARLTHPNVVTVHDVQLTADAAFIEMEYIKGRSLKDVLVADSSAPVEWVWNILEQLCDVLQVTHEMGVVHRDLKPSNLMLIEGRRPGRELLKVLDFGIAKNSAADLDEDDEIKTLSGSFLGTAHYSSPEQACGEKIDGRSDIYSTGVILYEMLTGKRPFSGPLRTLIYQHTSVPPPPFTETNPASDIPTAIEEVVRACLAKNPADRPQSGRDLADAFADAMERSGTDLRRSPRSSRAPLRTSTSPGETDLAVTERDEGGNTLAAPASTIRDFLGQPESPTVGPSKASALRTHGTAIAIAGLLALAIVLYLLSPASPLRRRSKDIADPQTNSKKADSSAEAESKRIDDQVAAWAVQGYEPDSAAGQSSGWPAALVRREDNARFALRDDGHYLPVGYLPRGESDSEDGWPQSLVRDEDHAVFHRIAGGSFTMGNLDEAAAPSGDPSIPAHPVRLSGFYMQTTEVTNGEMESYYAHAGREPAGRWKATFDVLTQNLKVENARKYPAVGIPWNTANEYAAKKSARLPTEAQWEYTARSRGKEYEYVWSRADRQETASTLANINSAGANSIGTMSVGSYDTDRTDQGILDLTGNVREWCRDVYKPYTRGDKPAVDPQFPPDRTGRSDTRFVVRGGSYLTLPDAGKTTYRDSVPGAEVGDALRDVGFRLVIECPEQAPPANVHAAPSAKD